jgi:anti-sigma factor ChrR (cupin superfamily)
LYRVNCPPTQVLVDYCQGLLEPRLYAAIAHHIALCPHCAHEIEWLTDGDVGSEPARYGGYLLASARRPLL